MNDEFGLPAVESKAPVDEKQRVAELRAKAEAMVAQEFDEDAVLAKLVAEARVRRMKALLPENDTVLPTDTKDLPEEYDRIEIFAGREKNDLAYVPLGLEGLVIKAPRGREIILPHIFVTECLDHAIENVTVRSQGGLISRPVARFPYNFKGKATKAEYQAFQKQEREQFQRDTALAA